MFVLCVLYSKGQKAKPGKSGQTSTEKVEREREQKKKCCRWGFFPKLLTEPSALGLTQPLKMSTRIILGVKTAGA
jgi:hypothetical protein